jgi:predicted amidohydrolase YtcJ
MKTDLIIKNGSIISRGIESSNITAVAIEDGKIVAIGNDDEIMQLVTEDTKVIDAKHNTVIPGMCDAHVHVAFTTEMYQGANIFYIARGANEPRKQYMERLLENVKKYAEEHPEKQAIMGVGWSPADFLDDPEKLPTCKELDWACADRPVLLKSYCHHYIWANSKAIEMSGITKDTELPPGCIIHKDENGNPAGVFQEFQAMNMLQESFDTADFSIEEYKKGILAYQNELALKNGITCAFDPLLNKRTLQAYRELLQEDRLKIRISAGILADPAAPLSQFDEWIEKKGKYDIEDRFKVNTFKFFFDGSGLEFYLLEPFEKKILDFNGLPEDYRGREIWPLEKAKEAFLKVAKAGFNIHVHAMGDGAVKEAIDAFEYVHKQGIDLREHRNIITHLMFVAEEDIIRMSSLGIIAAMQPQWGVYNSFADAYMVPHFGVERTNKFYPTGKLLKEGVICSTSTDYPVIPSYAIIPNIQSSITRAVLKSAYDYEKYKDRIEPYPEFKVTLEELVLCSTYNGAYQLNFEDITGSIEVGKSADIIIFDHNMQEIPTEEIENVSIAHVILRGQEEKVK